MIQKFELNKRQAQRRYASHFYFIAVCFLLLIFGDNGNTYAGQYNRSITYLANEDFTYGTYIIDKPGIYRLTEDISFNPNSPDTLTHALNTGEIPPALADELGLPNPVDAYHAGFPLFTQYVNGGVESFSPGGPVDPRYDPRAFGLGFFAAIVIQADNVILDLNGHTIEQSAEHALLQRFFAVIETADQPFIPEQGPAHFGPALKAAKNVMIKNGTIGRSAHHGIHGNGNENIWIKNVDFVDYEVSAVALNGVKGLVVRNVHASNRQDVPVLGTFSSAQFIKPYVEELVRRNVQTELVIDGAPMTAEDIQDALKMAVNNVYQDIIASPNWVDGRAQIDKQRHPDEYALFHNPLGIIDGNSYSFVVNALGVAVDGFPLRPSEPARHIYFSNVHVGRQTAFINEIVALNQNDKAVIDPVGAVFQIRNIDPDTGAPITVSSLIENEARYLGNPVANAQAFVAKAFLNGDFNGSPLDLSRLNITDTVLMWVEGRQGYETLDSIVASDDDYYCNGDSMFHVNKGVVAFKIDAAKNVRMRNTSINNVANLGTAGSTVCGDYWDTVSHPKATLTGYGGARARGYSFAGSSHVVLKNSRISNLTASQGSSIGVDIFTDAKHVRIKRVEMERIEAGLDDPSIFYEGPNELPRAIGYHIGEMAKNIYLRKICATDLEGAGGAAILEDWTDTARVGRVCR